MINTLIKIGMGNSKAVIGLVSSISGHYESEDLRRMIREMEEAFLFTDESDYFSGLVNFSKNKNKPFHKWVRYREAYSSELVKEVIKRSGASPEKDFVIDPMSGSGTTMVAAAEIGFDSLGLDVNPFCLLIAKAKLHKPSESTLAELEKVAVVTCHKAKTKKVDRESTSYKRFSPYFVPANLDSLEKLRSVIANCKNEEIQTLLHFAWLTIIEECSNRRKDGNGLATVQTKISDVYKRFTEKVGELIYDYKHFPIAIEPQTEIFVDSAAATLFDHAKDFSQTTKKQAGVVVFSPPYANSFDYFESYKLELLYGGLVDDEEFLKHRAKAVRSYRPTADARLKADSVDISHNDEVVEAICKEILERVPRKEARTGVRDGRTRLVPTLLRGYFSDMKDVLGQIYESLKNGGKCYIVVDQSAYVGVIVPTDLLLARIAASLGFKVNGLIKCRRALTSGQQMSEFPYLKNALRESIIELSKPAL